MTFKLTQPTFFRRSTILFIIGTAVSLYAESIKYTYSVNIDSEKLLNANFIDEVDLNANRIVESYDKDGNFALKVVHNLSYQRSDEAYCSADLEKAYKQIKRQSSSRKHISKRKSQLADNPNRQWDYSSNFEEQPFYSSAKPSNYSLTYKAWNQEHTDLAALRPKTIPFISIKGIPIFQYYFDHKQECWQAHYVHSEITRDFGDHEKISITVKYMVNSNPEKNRWKLKSVTLPIKINLID